MYYEDDNYRIQAAMALRISEIAQQYARIPLSPKEKFSETLHLCLLQNLLSHCNELLKAMARDGGEGLGLHVPLQMKSDWGINTVIIEKYSFEASLTVAEFLDHLRNAMCHPTGTNLEAKFPSTGYNAIPDDNKLPIAERKIVAVGFCDSPDTQRNQPITWRLADEGKANKYLKAKQDKGLIPMGVKIDSSGHNRVGMFHFREPYAREFLAIFSTVQLASLVVNLSNLLAHPADPKWDGKTTINMYAKS